MDTSGTTLLCGNTGIGRGIWRNKVGEKGKGKGKGKRRGWDRIRGDTRKGILGRGN
jgi:hypothetical protein